MEAFHIQEDHAVEALNAAVKSLGNIKDKLDESMEQNKGGKYMTEPIAEATVASNNAKKKIKQLEKAMLYNVKYMFFIFSCSFFLFLPAHTLRPPFSCYVDAGIGMVLGTQMLFTCWNSNVGAQMLVVKHSYSDAGAQALVLHCW